ncbi:hypothetical protein LCM20_08085 [Halobacillus litoralis]|uniref:hypothetical protein n=1 Tax=Halobacillus litoralis TaxID=45668 RepID=UPI001CD3EE00|nr:hypothetical protein [Halobacillus litoralis]MCA0970541.1 hypothetical protein [Halobacillus litoralis]
MKVKKKIYAVQLILIPFAFLLVHITMEWFQGTLSMESVSGIFPILVIFFFVTNTAWFLMEEKLSAAIARDEERIGNQR